MLSCHMMRKSRGGGEKERGGREGGREEGRRGSKGILWSEAESSQVVAGSYCDLFCRSIHKIYHLSS